MKRPAVFIDRDDTIIHNSGDLGDPEEVRLIQGAAAAIASIRGLGYKVVVITNQGGVARGKYGEEDVNKVHVRVSELVEAKTTGAYIDAYYYCPYHPKGVVPEYTREHPDRKPQPGMLLRAAEDLEIDLTKSWTIGDQLRDCEAGKAAGTRTIHLDPKAAGGVRPEVNDGGPADYAVGTLIEAVRIIAQQRKPEVNDEKKRSTKMWDKARIAELQKPRGGQPETYKPTNTNKPFRPLDLAVPEEGEAFEENIQTSANQPASAQVSAFTSATNSTSTSRLDSTSQEAVLTEQDIAANTASEEQAVESVASTSVKKVAKKKTSKTASKKTSKKKATKKKASKTTKKTAAQKASQLSNQSASDEDAQAEANDASPAQAPGLHNQQNQASASMQATVPPDAAQPAAVATQSSVISDSSAASKIDAAAPNHDSAASRHVTIQANPETERLLRQILQEVRQRRGMSDFGPTEIFAFGLQAIAVICLIGGLSMGPETWPKWIGTAVMAQLATIACLLFSRR